MQFKENLSNLSNYRLNKTLEKFAQKNDICKSDLTFKIKLEYLTIKK